MGMAKWHDFLNTLKRNILLFFKKMVYSARMPFGAHKVKELNLIIL